MLCLFVWCTIAKHYWIFIFFHPSIHYLVCSFLHRVPGVFWHLSRLYLGNQLFSKALVKTSCGGGKILPPFVSGILVHLWLTSFPLPWQKSHHPRWRRSGWLVKLKACLACFSEDSWTDFIVLHLFSVSWLVFDPLGTWVVPVIGPDEVFQPHCPSSIHPHWWGVNVHPLSQAP